MNDGDGTSALALSQGNDLSERLWAFDAVADDPVPDVTGGLVSLGFILAALRRGARVWCVLAAAGLLIGAAAYKAHPPPYQASTTILLGPNNIEQSSTAGLDDQTLVQSLTVARDALRKLGLRENPASFLANYSALALTSRVLSITVKAASYQAAISEGNALAAAFLAFQKQELYAQEKQVNGTLQQQINQAQQHVNQIRQKIHQPSVSSAQRARLSTELAQQDQALSSFKLANQGNQNTMRINTATLVDGSRVLDAATPLPQHAKRYLLLYVGGGLIVGLLLGLVIVIIRALISDKLRRRDEVAHALGAPVKLSVGKVRLSRWRPGRHGLAAAWGKDIRRIVAHLECEVLPSQGGPVGLALVPIDDVQVPAICLAALAIDCAKRGFRVVMADLCGGSPAARLLDVTKPGVQPVRVHDADLIVAVTDPDDVAPVGPLGRSRRAQAHEPLANACASADLLFTLAAIDPTIGAEHLPGWARDAVAVVTTGRSSAERVQTVGELIRLAGVDLVSAVLVGADKTDESLGAIAPSSPSVAAPFGS